MKHTKDYLGISHTKRISFIKFTELFRSLRYKLSLNKVLYMQDHRKVPLPPIFSIRMHFQRK